MVLKVKPSEKIKRRYILVEGDVENVEKVIEEGIGTLGLGDAKIIFIQDDKDVIVGIERKYLDKILGVFEICKEDFKVKKVSGTIKGLG